jgi:endonuclease/exonuclease/phosphatase family metal-dependent hydrolase
MRLATFNVLHGLSPGDGAVDVERLQAAVRLLRADVLGLQEVDRGQPRSHGLDLVARAAEATTEHGDGAAHLFASALIGTPGAAWRTADARDVREAAVPHAAPAYGIGMIIRWPVRSWHILRLRAAPVRSPIAVPGEHLRVVLLTDEPRVVLAAVVESPFGLASVATTHLSFVPGWNVRQLRRTLRALERLPAPRFLLGDFNLPGVVVSAVRRSGWRSLAAVPTYPAEDPLVQFDHVLTHGDGRVGVSSVETPWADLSDHRPLVVEVSGFVR